MLSKMFCRAKKTIKEYRDWQMKVYTRVQDTLEQRLAGVIAAKQKLAEQMERDATVQLHKDIKESSVEE